jgi:hypothetical protein
MVHGICCVTGIDKMATNNIMIKWNENDVNNNQTKEEA